ncbi:glutamine amidotransferase subunit DUG2 [Sugiyamaella lignohabitans]|uniref:Glutamine amidotransferase subunit DUG2 n=1 Tax=Sugiyamaella lignohabitans TaxID=796027 RepID=A0A167FET0_9ASCO|nr:glutamine amidotransferase subunit DUG2 [Sugiyamaella lignohabitans]ANB15209.1 glutamine amidotransferase subunit DUG2 [Sugiyamaella lignohabitans]
MSLVTSASYVYAGTETGEILIYDLETYQFKESLPGHNGSIFSLLLTSCAATPTKPSHNLLVSAASDSLIKVWSLSTLSELYTIYSYYDIGDIFSLAWSQDYQTLYFGAQNASIQWIKLHGDATEAGTKQDPSGLPSVRFDKFFDSTGPGGKLSPQQHAIKLKRSSSSSRSSFTDLTKAGLRRESPGPFQTSGSPLVNERLLSSTENDGTNDSAVAVDGDVSSVFSFVNDSTDSFNANSNDSSLLEVLRSNIVRFAHNGYIHSMLVTKTVSTNNGLDVLVSGAGDGTVKIWNLNKGSTLHLLRSLELENSIMSMIRGTDSFLYCGLTNGQVVMYDIDTSQVLRVDTQESSDVMALCAVGESVFKGTAGLVQKWDPSKYCRSEWKAHNGLTLAMAFSSYKSNPVLISGGNDATIALWDINNTVKTASEIPSLGPLSISPPTATPNLTSSPSVAEPLTNNVVALDNDNMIQTLTEFVSYKTISGYDFRHWSDNRRCATYLRSLLNHFGASSQLLAVHPNGNPIVYGCFSGIDSGNNSKKSRILFYGHYDVITASRSDKWETDPFDLTAIDGYLYGRGVSDNKGPILAAIFAVAELFQSSKLQNDVVFLFEGEEECGSTGFSETILKNKELIGNIDWIILSNSYWLDDTTPCLNYGLRGIINACITVSSDKPDLHSGVHGGVHREPTVDMVNLLAKLTSDDGKILIPQFDDSVRPVDAEEDKLYEAITRTPGVLEDKETLMRKWRYPSMTIHGINASGPGNTTVIPASVSASISFRIVPDQDIEQIKKSVQDYLEGSFLKFRSSNKLSVNFSHEAEPWLGDPTNKPFQILRRALRNEWQVEPLFIREGGSIPVVRVLEKIFDAPAAQLPCGQASDHAHLDNERLRITNFFKTRNVFKQAFTELCKD